MGAQSPFDKSQARFVIHKVVRNDHEYIAAYFIVGDDGSTVNVDEPIAISAVTHPDYPDSRAQFEWLVTGCAAFHDVETHNFFDDPKTAQITYPPSHWKQAQ